MKGKAMKDKNCEILLEYLRNILYGSGDMVLDWEHLDEPFQELGREMQRLPVMAEQLREKERQLRQKEEWALKEQKKLTGKAYVDALCNIPNRLYFVEKMGQIIRECMHFTMCYVDLDNLKAINDRFGHREGDDYICEFVSKVRARIREYDLFCRIGGDEFCLVFPECHMEAVGKKMEKILEEFADYGAPHFRASFSYGLIEMKDEENRPTLEELMADADEKMYQMKREHKAKESLDWKKPLG
ncbi:MAG: GGDEF domain-containing protein [Brotaphodocola sp.]